MKSSHETRYFITIATKNYDSYFGVIIKGKMLRNPMGEYALCAWERSAIEQNDSTFDAFVVMPNHIHGIVRIHNQAPITAAGWLSERSPDMLSPVIDRYKIVIKEWCHECGYTDFDWEPHYYARLIRRESELRHMHRYIQENPIHWHSDRYNKNNVIDSVRARYMASA